MKRAAILISSGVLLLLAAVIVLPSFIDWNRYREDVAGILETAMGRDIRLGGLSFRLLPQPTLRAADVTVANVPEGKSPYFARLEALDVRVALLPLIRGTINIQSLGLVAPHLALETLPNGRNNWTFGQDGAGNGAAATDVQIEALTITEGEVDYRNLGTGRTISVTVLEATLTAESLSGPFSGSGTAVYSGVPLTVEASTGQTARASGTPLSATVGLADTPARATFSGQLAMPAEGARATGKVRIEGENLNRAVQAAARMGGVPPPRLPAVPFRMATDVDAGPKESTFDSLSLTLDDETVEGRARAATANGGTDLEIDLSTTRFNLDTVLAQMPESGDSGGSTPARFTLPRNVTADIRLSANALDFREEIIRRAELALALKDGSLRVAQASALFPGGMDITLSGTVQSADGRPRFTGRIEAGARNFRRFLTWTGTDVSNVPAGRLAQLDLTSDLELAPGRVRMESLAMTLDSTGVRGSFGLKAGEPAALNADLTIDRLPLDAYLPAREPDSGPVDLAPLAALRGDIALTADRLSYADTILNDVNARLGLEAGTLDISKLAVGGWAGTRLAVEGQVSELAAEPIADLGVKAEGKSAGRAIRALGIGPLPANPPLGAFALDGTITGNRRAVTLDLSGRVGRTQLDLVGEFSDLQTVPRAAVDFRAASPRLASLSGQLGLDLAPVSGADPVATTISGRLEGTKDTGKADLELELAGGRFGVTGTYATDDTGVRYDVDLTGTHPDPARLFQALGYDYRPAGPLGAAGMKMAIAGSPDSVRMEKLHLTVGDMRVDGSAVLDRGGEKPSLTAKLAGTTLDLNALLPPPETGLRKAQAVESDTTAAKARARWSREAIDWSGLNALNADIEFTADAIEYRTYRFGEPSLTLSLRDGTLEMAPVSAELFGGNAQLNMTVAAGPPARIQMDIDLSDIAVESFLTATAGNPAATGTADLTGAFSGAGETQYDIIRGLTGKARFTARNGVIRRIDLPRFSDRLNNLTRMQDFLDLADSALSGGETPYREISGTLIMENGIARTMDTRADIAAGEATLTATLDLPAWSIDGKGVFRLTEAAGAPPIVVDITGPIDDPDRRVNTRELRDFAAGKVGAAALKRVIGDPEQSGLGDLLGRRRTEAPNGENTMQDAPEEDAALEGLLKGLEKLRGPAGE